MERKETFDTVAQLYDAVRPGYPEELVEEVLARAALGEGERVLEIGCGTGKATLPYARRGLSLLCLEPGPNLAALARRNLAAFPNVEILETGFEAWPEEPGAFGLVYAATAWHHVDPEVRYRKAASILRPGGTLAIYAHFAEAFHAGQEAYRRHWPGYAGVPPAVDERVAKSLASLERSGCFQDLAVHRYPWTRRFTADEYLALLGTSSDHLLLPNETRESLFQDLHHCIESQGGTLTIPWQTVLFLGLKAES